MHVLGLNRQGHPTRIPPVNSNYIRINFTSTPLHYCEPPVVLLVLIRSSLRHVARRQEIRSTWANQRHYQKLRVSIRHAFVLGEALPADASPFLHSTLKKESELEGDLILADFADTYENLTYKTMTGMRWAVEYCHHFQYALLLDDDMHIYLKNLLRFLSNPEKYPDATRASNGLFNIPNRETFYAGQLFGLRKNLPERPHWLDG